MDGYDFITMVDGKRWGTVVDREDDYVIVEHGMLRKHRYAVPQSSIEIVDDDKREVQTTLSGELIEDSPQVERDFDREAVARHYGLAPTDAPPTEGWGDTVTADPTEGAEYQAQRAEVDSPVEERARIREGTGGETDAMPDESPALLGDRLSDVRDDEPRR